MDAAAPLAALPVGQAENADLAPLLHEMPALSTQDKPTLPRIESGQDETGRAGDTLGPYRLLRLLGQGGMGNVWLATDAFRAISGSQFELRR